MSRWESFRIIVSRAWLICSVRWRLNNFLPELVSRGQLPNQERLPESLARIPFAASTTKCAPDSARRTQLLAPKLIADRGLLLCPLSNPASVAQKTHTAYPG